MMSYANILWAFGFTALGAAAHVVWWRVRRPRDDVRALGACLVALPLAGVALWALFADTGPAGARGRDALVVGLLSALLGGVYIISYPGAQAGSPSMLILLRVAGHGAEGVGRAELAASFDERTLCDETLASLVHERFARRSDGRLVPAPRGKSMFRTCQAWRALLGLRDGEG
jgi:hypothetical protein